MYEKGLYKISITKKYVKNRLFKDLKMSCLNFNFLMIYIVHKILVLLKNYLNYLQDYLKEEQIFFIIYNDGNFMS